MGTRGLTKVILDGEVRVAQYGQWDHYPEGQGLMGLKIIRGWDEYDWEDFKESVRELKELTDEVTQEWLNVFNNGSTSLDDKTYRMYNNQFPGISRDIGTDILTLIKEGEVTYVKLNTEFENDPLWCEGVVILNLDAETYGFKVSGYGGQPDKIVEWPLSDLPDDVDFVVAFEEKE